MELEEQNEQEETIEEPIQPSVFTEAEAQAIEVPEPVEPPVFLAPPTPIKEPEKPVEVAVREPASVPMLEPIPEPKPEEQDELASLFEVPQLEDNDMATDHLFEVGEDLTGFEDDDLSDLVDVTQEDIMGDSEGEPYPGTPPSEELPQRAPVRRFKRTPRRYPPPPTSLGGVRY